MAAKTVYCCSKCNSRYSKWVGQCNECGQWDTLVETIDHESKKKQHPKFTEFVEPDSLQRLSEIDVNKTPRFDAGQAELNRVLGGGLVPGSVVLLGGDPGIGKSTLVLQMLSSISQFAKVLYLCGEESTQQIALRARRLKIVEDNIQIVADTVLERILKTCKPLDLDVVVIDSIQTIYSEQFNSAPGSVTQVRESAAAFVRFAKQTNCVVILIGHVTKDGYLAGPRVLEHMVDCVLYFEGENKLDFRIIRAIKNRFGAVNEIGVFAMTQTGLKGVNNPSSMFISSINNAVSGTVILVAIEGNRPILVEIQALVDKSFLANPRRHTVGLESNRLSMILAVLHRHTNCQLQDCDVFVNVIGGLKIQEPAADLAIAVAIWSSFHNMVLPSKLAVFGEIGLTGEIRPVQQGQQRIKEAVKLGYDQMLIPKANMPKKSREFNVRPILHIKDVQTNIG